jgi:cytochrome c556
MRSPAIAMSAALILAVIVAGPAVAQSASHVGDIPQAMRVEHDNTLQQLTALSQRHGPVGVEARKALALFKAHLQREEEFILPPLTLLHELADGKVSPDMKWAIAMSDRVKAEREKTFQEHTQITGAMSAIAAAARKAHDAAALDFAQAAVADSLTDLEPIEPMSIVIGDYLKAKLPAGQ